ncbi:MAG: hypothetical protein JW881_17635 [Spirochaetales bacterium]|nr:hypothetical protein [Spirochaetales bacterium]
MHQIRDKAVISGMILLFLVCLEACLGLMTDGEGGFLSLFFMPETEGASYADPQPGSDWERVRAVSGIAIDTEPGTKLAGLTDRVKKKPKQHLVSLVEALTAGTDDPFRKAKAIHDWIAMNINYDADAYFKNKVAYVQPHEVLRRGSSVCAGYANLFAAMCGMAGIDCLVVTGYGRGAGFSAFREKAFDNNHAWNAVLLEGGWYLVDCTWDAGYVSDTKFTRSYDTGYFCTPPDGFLHSHFPQNPVWQLIDKPLSFAEFHNRPKFEGRFFKLGLTLESKLSLVTKTKDRIDVTLGVPHGIQISGAVISLEKEFRIFPSFMRRREGSIETFSIIFPKAGKYYLTLAARQTDGAETGDIYLPIGLIFFEAASGSKRIFPSCSTEIGKYGISVESPVLPYNPEVTEPFPITMKTEDKTLDLTVMLFKKTEELFGRPIEGRSFIQSRDGRYTFHVSFPEKGRYNIKVFVKITEASGSSHYDELVSFPVTAMKKTPYSFPRIDPNQNISIITPIYNPLKRDTEAAFEIRAPGLEKVFVHIEGVYRELDNGSAGLFSGTFRIEGETVSLYYEKKKNYYIRIAEYDVE